MNDQPVSLIIGESFLVAIGVVLGAVLTAGWLMGRGHRARGLREAPPNAGDVPSHSHYPASLGR